MILNMRHCMTGIQRIGTKESISFVPSKLQFDNERVARALQWLWPGLIYVESQTNNWMSRNHYSAD
jgi:hypothetical protein